LVEAEFNAIRQHVAFLESDRFLATDIETMRQWALQANLPATLLNILPSYS
jgi:histidine ammonia-lyase